MSILGNLMRAAPAGLAAVRRGQMAGDQQRQQRERQEAADARQAEMHALTLALTRGQAEAAGVRQGAAPAAPATPGGATGMLPMPGMNEGMLAAMDQALTSERYQDLGGGYHLDREGTPLARQQREKAEREQQARTLAEQQARQHRETYGAVRGRFGADAVGEYAPDMDYGDVFHWLLDEQGQNSRHGATLANQRSLAALRAGGGGSGAGGGAGGGAGAVTERDKAREGMALLNRPRPQAELRAFQAKLGELTARNPGMDMGLAAWYANQEIGVQAGAQASATEREAASAVSHLTETEAVAELQQAGFGADEVARILELLRGARPEEEGY